MRTRKLAAVMLAFALGAQSLFAQSSNKPQTDGQPQQDEPLRLKSSLIELRVVVTDKRGNLVTDLKKEDFQLEENGRAQNIEFFFVNKIGAEPARATPEAEAEAKVERARSASPARTVVLFVDTIHMTASGIHPIKKALRKFVNEQMTPDDVAAIITSTGSLGVLEQFTKERSVLNIAIDRLKALRVTDDGPFYPFLAAMVARDDVNAINAAIAILQNQEGPLFNYEAEVARAKARADMILNAAVVRRKATLNTLKAVTERLAGMPGQRLLALFSEGFSMTDGRGGFDTYELNAVTSRAVGAGVVIYSVDARGLQGPPGFDAASNIDISNPSVRAYLSDSEKELDNGLNSLAHDTGGEFFRNTNDMSTPVRKALEENQVYYSLSYNSSSTEDPKKFRRVKIKIKDRPDYEVRAQRGYIPRELERQEEKNRPKTPREAVIKAMSSPLPVTGIPIGAMADILKTKEGKGLVSLQIYVDAKELNFQQQGQSSALDLEATISIFDAAGKLASGFSDTIKGSLTQARLEQAKQNGITYIKQAVLKPGLYHARVAVREPSTERIGTAVAWFEIPNYEKSKLALSSLILSERQPGSNQPAAEIKPGEIFYPNVSQGVKLYNNGSLLVYQAVVYRGSNKASDDEALEIRLEIAQGEQSVYRTDWQPLSSRLLNKTELGLEIGGQVGLNLKPGLYEVRITVRDTKSKRVAEQSAMFIVSGASKPAV